jgi:hypothetical protein
MFNHVLAESVVGRVARSLGGLGRFEAHVVPAKIFEIAAAHLAEALGLHCGAGRTLAGEKSGGEGSERLGFSHGSPPY